VALLERRRGGYLVCDVEEEVAAWCCESMAATHPRISQEVEPASRSSELQGLLASLEGVG
jgi:hypothetical protein